MRRTVATGASATGALLLACVLFAVSTPAWAQTVYTVGNYPAEASAANAVAAKNVALAEAQASAWRYLMKRLVRVTAFKRLPKLSQAEIENMVEGVSVRNEQNSSTDYLATLDIAFKPPAIKKVLQQYNLPYLDQQSGPITIIPVFAVDAGAGTGGNVRPEEAQRLWRQAWNGLDLTHALTPVRLAVPGPSSDNDLFVKLAKGDARKLGIVEGETSAERLLVALAMAVEDGKRLQVQLIGRDWVGDIWWRNTTRIAAGDFGYTAEAAAILSLAVLEGRWKMRAAAGSTAGQPEPAIGQSWAAGYDPVLLTAEFTTLQQWQQMRQTLAQVPGVQGLQVGQLSTRQADVTLAYPGGPETLATTLASEGLSLVNEGGRWILRAI